MTVRCRQENLNPRFRQ